MSHHWTWTSQTTFPSRMGAHLVYMQEVMTQLKNLGWNGRDLFGIEMALEESLSNAIRHGNCCDEAKEVAVECKISPDRFWLRVSDQGPGFKLAGVPDCTADENLECPGGRGLALIRAYMTQVEHNQAGNCVTMEKIRSTTSNGPCAGRPCEPNELPQK